MAVIDATNLIAGRLATAVAKRALLGEKIDIINSERAVITGKRKEILESYKKKVKRGNALKGPYFPKMPDRLLRRIIRGMLPYKQDKGLKAYKRIMCYLGIPDSLKDQTPETIKSASVLNSKALKYIPLAEICKIIKKWKLFIDLEKEKAQ